MPCKNFRGQLSLYANGDLAQPQAQLVSDHVQSCPNCRLQVQSFERTRSILGGYAQHISKAPEARDLFGGVMGRLNQKASPKNRPPRGFQA